MSENILFFNFIEQFWDKTSHLAVEKNQIFMFFFIINKAYISFRSENSTLLKPSRTLEAEVELNVTRNQVVLFSASLPNHSLTVRSFLNSPMSYAKLVKANY